MSVSDGDMYRASTERRISSVELDVALLKQDHTGLKDDVKELRNDIKTAARTGVGTLITVCGFVLWYVITHSPGHP